MSGFSLLLSHQERLLQGAWLTFQLAVYSLILALILGILACIAQSSSKRFYSRLALGYTTIVRGVPDLVQLFLLYYGGQFILNKITTALGYPMLEMTPFITGILTIGFMFGAYMAESFRGGLQAIPKGQLEAARAFGMNERAIFWRITRPQMLRYALPSIGNNWLVLMKSTSLVSIIGLKDLVFVANVSARAAQRKDLWAGFWFYGAVAVFFLLMTTISLGLLSLLQKKYSAHLSQPIH
ncbi:MAG: ABC transporter permease subunit [Cardiobacteriaceae bacterium]|nr:ABC transporter permease subunit [Cardiobacteriaceae bacterium]